MKNTYKCNIIELFQEKIKHIDNYQHNIPLLSPSMGMSPYEVGAFLLILKVNCGLTDDDVFAIIENNNFTLQNIEEYINNRFSH